ncbi:MAG: DNA polymerase/3'-5' exonuclease PolX [Microscillaceae bacterium]|nr:DNA polymerase/3'-5' exonuclease PolX [Microscillaceae bacterium]
MDNQEIIRQIKLYASILEIQGESSFKIRSYHNAIYNIDKLEQSVSELSLAELEKLPGIGKAIAAKIHDAQVNGIFRQLKEAQETVPPGIIDMLEIDGLGAKKISILWQELGIEDTDQLLQACENDQIAQVKGFGAKTQENIKQVLLFKLANSDKFRYADAEKLSLQLEEYFREFHLPEPNSLCGQMRRRTELIDRIEWLIASNDPDAVYQLLDSCDFLQKDEQKTGLFAWRGHFKASRLRVEFRICRPEQFASELFILSASSEHLRYKHENQTLLQIAHQENFSSEEAIYQKLNLPYIIPEWREGHREFEMAQTIPSDQLVHLQDIQGILHAHSTYSDGKHSLETMALACKELGYSYLGISDHSKSAFYANGLQEHRVRAQHQEIDALNEKLAPFKIFKGIESDILADGSLDYEPDVLKSFDFVIASIHSGLKMNEEKATQRIIKAVENPFTTILGHVSGRILLRREAYPLDYPKIIDACAANGVSIEINASPWRLDLDWRWVYEAQEKGIIISINPDAHETEGIQDVYYGVQVARKGGLKRQSTLNTLDSRDIAQYFLQKKP